MKDLIWIIDAFMNTPLKIQYTRELIEKIKIYGEDIAVVSHTPIPEDIQKSVNYSIYDCRNYLIKDWSTTLWYGNNDLKLEYSSGNTYQGFSIYLNRKNAISLLKSDYKRGIFIEYDFDHNGLSEFREKTKDFLFNYDLIGRRYKDTGIDRGVLTDIYSVNLSMADEIFPSVDTWEQFQTLESTKLFENLVYNRFLRYGGIIKMIKMEGKIVNKVYSDGVLHFILCDEVTGGIIAFFYNRDIEGVGVFKINNSEYCVNPGRVVWFRMEKKDGTRIITDDKEYILSSTESYKGKFRFRENLFISSYWTERETNLYGTEGWL
jgi:hypothetical protein